MIKKKKGRKEERKKGRRTSFRETDVLFSIILVDKLYYTEYNIVN